MDDNSTKIDTSLPSGDEKSVVNSIIDMSLPQNSDSDKSADSPAHQVSASNEDAANDGATTECSGESMDTCDSTLSGEASDIATQDLDAPKPTPSNLDDFEADKDYISDEERIQTAFKNNPVEPCARDAKTDEKISKYSTYACVPFFIAGIVVTLFDKAKYRSPWSFLLIGLAVFVLAIGALLRYRNNKKCKCSVCDTQAKTLRSSAILWGLLAVGCMIGFVVFLIINKGV